MNHNMNVANKLLENEPKFSISQGKNEIAVTVIMQLG